MTIKIDTVNVDDSDKPEVREEKRRRKSKEKKEKGDGGKTKGKGSGAKDIKDINERLKAQASYGEDVELDYDDIHEDGKDKQVSDTDGEISVSILYK